MNFCKKGLSRESVTYLSICFSITSKSIPNLLLAKSKTTKKLNNAIYNLME